MASEKKNVAHTVGKFSSIGSFSSILAMGVVFLFVETTGYRNLYYISGGIAVSVGFYMFLQKDRAAHISTERKIVFRAKYWLYYVLSFLEGSKKHISSTFSIFLLVSEFHVSARNISLLFMINSIITSYTHQRLGKIVDKFGERTVLIFYYIMLVAVYLGYGLIKNVIVICVIFVLANTALGLAVALNSYFHKIAPPEQITSNVSMRTTIDHTAAIFIPLIGGLIWSQVGYFGTFLMGICIAVLALVFSLFIKTPPVPAGELESNGWVLP